MRNFFLLIRRFWNLILFLILETICISLIAKSHSIQGLSIVNSSNSIAGYIYKKQNDILYYFQLKRLNNDLLAENAKLNTALSKVEYIDTFKNSIAKIPIIVSKDSASKAKELNTPDSLIKKVGPATIVHYSEYNYIPARVLKNSISNDKINFITLNRGSEDGIRKDMAVVTGNGIVGRIANVSKHYSTAASILSDRVINVQLKDGTSGFISWKPGNPSFVIMDKVPTYQPVKKGDSIFSTSYSYFPVNIYIGRVRKIDTMKATNDKKLTIQLSTNFRNLQFVYVVGNEMDTERKNLEKETKTVDKK